MVKVIQEDEEMGIDSNICNEELILEGPEMESSKAIPIIQEDTMPSVPLMPVNMEITSIEDFKVHEETKPRVKDTMSSMKSIMMPQMNSLWKRKSRLLRPK